MEKEKRVRDEASGNGKKDAKRVKLNESAKSHSFTKPHTSGNGKAKELVSSKESHQKQKSLAKERRAAKPNADIIARAKKIWESLRRKSHVAKDERKKLVAELFTIITGRVRDFVFKHDAVRPVQCALKYANTEQTTAIAKELKGEFKTLAEGRYAKFLVAKMIVEGNREVRDMIIAEFYGSVRRMIMHPEAAWILDDTYRQVATPKQKGLLLREWYGVEFAMANKADVSGSSDKTGKDAPEADLRAILRENPEKRKPIMEYTFGMINMLVQKEKTGFTMLHDAMQQYSLCIGSPTDSPAAGEFMELLKGDEKGDLLKNLAFTLGGADVMCRALAFGSAKDRKHMLRVYKDHIQTMAYDANACQLLLVAYEVVDDTKMVGKLIFPELLDTKQTDTELRYDSLLRMVNDLTARIPLLYLFTTSDAKWLFPPARRSFLELIRGARQWRVMTSKKDAGARQRELAGYLGETSSGLLDFIVARAAELLSTSFGCQFVSEVLLSPLEGDKTAALQAIAHLASGDPTAADHPFNAPKAGNRAAAGRMLKNLVSSAKFDAEANELKQAEPPVEFTQMLWPEIQKWAVQWATGANSFVVLNMLEDAAWKDRSALEDVMKMSSKELMQATKEGNNGAQMINLMINDVVDDTTVTTTSTNPVPA